MTINGGRGVVAVDDGDEGVTGGGGREERAEVENATITLVLKNDLRPLMSFPRGPAARYLWRGL